VSGNGNHGTPQNTSLLGERVLTPRGRGVRLDGVDDYITVPITNYVTKPFSLLVWCSLFTYTSWRSAFGIKINNQSNQTPFYLHARRNYANNEYDFEWDGDVNDVGDVASGPSQFPSGLNMLGGMVTYERVYVILNGEIKNSVPRTRGFPTSTQYYSILGAAMYNNAVVDYTNGDFLLAQIYGRPLSVREWAELYADPWAMYRVRPRVLVRGVTLPAKKTPIYHLVSGCT
jgi:hypothetical protein